MAAGLRQHAERSEISAALTRANPGGVGAMPNDSLLTDDDPLRRIVFAKAVAFAGGGAQRNHILVPNCVQSPRDRTSAWRRGERRAATDDSVGLPPGPVGLKADWNLDGFCRFTSLSS